MKRYVRLLITVCALLALVGVAIVVYRRADRKFHDRMAESYEFKRTHVSSGTVLSITPVQVGKEPERDVDNFPHFKICFSIDSFKDVPRDLQEQYETAEKLRTAKEGPRCMVPREALRHGDLKPGDAIEVDYLLYGSGIITVSRIVVCGQDLTSKRAWVARAFQPLQDTYWTGRRWPRCRGVFQSKLRVPPVPRFWGPGREAHRSLPSDSCWKYSRSA